MYNVYAIKSIERNYIYVGLTSNFERRFSDHTKGLNRTTKPYAPFRKLLIETFGTRQEARNREKYLKSGVDKEYIKKNFS